MESETELKKNSKCYLSFHTFHEQTFSTHHTNLHNSILIFKFLEFSPFQFTSYNNRQLRTRRMNSNAFKTHIPTPGVQNHLN